MGDADRPAPRVGNWAGAIALLGLLGALIGYFAIKSEDEARANHILKWGLIMMLPLAVGWLAIGTLLASSGVDDQQVVVGSTTDSAASATVTTAAAPSLPKALAAGEQLPLAQRLERCSKLADAGENIGEPDDEPDRILFDYYVTVDTAFNSGDPRHLWCAFYDLGPGYRWLRDGNLNQPESASAASGYRKAVEIGQRGRDPVTAVISHYYVNEGGGPSGESVVDPTRVEATFVLVDDKWLRRDPE